MIFFVPINILEVSIPILRFYGWWQFGVCLFAFIALLSIWYHIGRKKDDFGQVWLAISILCWSFSGIVEVLFTYDIFLNQNYLSGFRSIFSLLNSLFILLALPYFKYLPKVIEQVIKSKNWSIIIGLPFLFSILPTFSKLIFGSSGRLISELDVYYSTMTLLFLGYVLWESFIKRKLNILAYLSAVCILITFAAQVFKLTDLQINLILFSAIFKTNLIMIFFALALSWVKDISETIKINPENIFLKLEKIKSDSGKLENIIWIKGIKNPEYSKVRLSNNMFPKLQKFASKKKHEEEAWLEIKPKSDNHKNIDYDIKDYNEIKRLTHVILDGIYGKGVWDKNKHEEPFKEAFFEMSERRDRKIRLRIPKNNIEIDKSITS